MLRGIASGVLMVCLFSGAACAAQFDLNELTTRTLLLEAVQSASPFQRETKLREILKISPENYYALVKLGELELEKGPDGHLKAEEYFLRAALEQPYRPEAFLALGQSYYSRGYAREGMNYMMMAMKGPYSKPSYAAICLQGQEFLDTGNYNAAVMMFGKAALSQSSPFEGDPYLLKKLYHAAALSPAPGLWVYAGTQTFVDSTGHAPWVPFIFAWQMGMENEKDLFRFMEMLRTVASEISRRHSKLTAAAAEKLIYMMIYEYVMDDLRSRVSDTEGLDSAIAARYGLTKEFFDFGICPTEKSRKLTPDLNLYDVFIEASVPDPVQRKALLEKLNEVKNQAIQHVEKISDPKERGRELYKWLRENLIVNYDMVDGIPAERVIKDHKYLCLSGAIVYALIARDAGLNVNGYVMPGHAYAVLHTDKGEKINVETTFPVRETAENPAGFDAPPLLAGMRSKDLRAMPDITGEVSPLDLVSYQFLNVGYNKLADLTLNKHGNLLREVLQKAGFKEAKIEQFMTEWREASLSSSEQRKAMILMSLASPKYHAELTHEIDKGLENMEKARSFDPLNKEFMRKIEEGAAAFTMLATASPALSMAKRFREQREQERSKVKEGIVDKMREEGAKVDKSKTTPSE